MIALAYLLLLFTVALTADLWIPQDKIAGMHIKDKHQSPNATYWSERTKWGVTFSGA